jgi:hypothetical protein
MAVNKLLISVAFVALCLIVTLFVVIKTTTSERKESVDELKNKIDSRSNDLLTPSRIKYTSLEIEESDELEIATSKSNQTFELLKEKKKLLNDKTCGTSAVNRVVGGSIAYPGNFRFYAGLMYNENDSLVVLCGGSLISGKKLSLFLGI